MKGSHSWTHLPKGPAQRQPIVPSHKVKINLLILKHCPEGQTSYLTHILKSLLELYAETETGKHHVCTLLLMYYRAPVSPSRELLYMSSVNFVAVTYRMPLDCLALEATGACVPGPIRLIINVTQKGAQPLSGAPIFATAARGHLAPVTRGAFTHGVPQDCN